VKTDNATSEEGGECGKVIKRLLPQKRGQNKYFKEGKISFLLAHYENLIGVVLLFESFNIVHCVEKKRNFNRLFFLEQKNRFCFAKQASKMWCFNITTIKTKRKSSLNKRTFV